MYPKIWRSVAHGAKEACLTPYKNAPPTCHAENVIAVGKTILAYVVEIGRKNWARRVSPFKVMDRN